MVNWEHVTDSDNAQEAYTLFHAQLSDIYNACFPLKKIKINIILVNLGLLKPWKSRSEQKTNCISPDRKLEILRKTLHIIKDIGTG